jgi:hypothetical protein
MLWLKVLIIGIVIAFIGIMIPTDRTFGVSGMYVLGIGALLVIGSIVAFATRLFGRMVSE